MTNKNNCYSQLFKIRNKDNAITNERMRKKAKLEQLIEELGNNDVGNNNNNNNNNNKRRVRFDIEEKIEPMKLLLKESKPPVVAIEQDKEPWLNHQHDKYNIKLCDTEIKETEAHESLKSRNHIKDLKAIVSFLMMSAFISDLKAINQPYTTIQQFCKNTVLLFMKNRKREANNPFKIVLDFAEFNDNVNDEHAQNYLCNLLYENRQLLLSIFRVRKNMLVKSEFEITESLRAHTFQHLYDMSENSRQMVTYSYKNRQCHTLYTYKFENETLVMKEMVNIIEDYFGKQWEARSLIHQRVYVRQFVPVEVIKQWNVRRLRLEIEMVPVLASQTGFIDFNYDFAHTDYKPLNFDSKFMHEMTKQTYEEISACRHFSVPIRKMIHTIFTLFAIAIEKLEWMIGRESFPRLQDVDANGNNKKRKVASIVNRNGTDRTNMYSWEAHCRKIEKDTLQERYRVATKIGDHVNDYASICHAFSDINFIVQLFFNNVYKPNCHRCSDSSRDGLRLSCLRKMKHIQMYSAYYIASSSAIIGDLGTSVTYLLAAKPLLIHIFKKKFPILIQAFYTELVYIAMAHLPSYPEAVKAVESLEVIVNNDMDISRRWGWKEFFDRAHAELKKNKVLYDVMHRRETMFYEKLLNCNDQFCASFTRKEARREHDQQQYSDSDSANWVGQPRRGDVALMQYTREEYIKLREEQLTAEIADDNNNNNNSSVF